jgi:hypothetical protein
MIRIPTEAADARMAASRKGETLDISTRGMYFIVEQDLQAGSELDITPRYPLKSPMGQKYLSERRVKSCALIRAQKHGICGLAWQR